MKKLNLVIVIIFGTIFFGYSQQLKQKVGDNPTLIAPSAVLEVQSTNKGVLIPRVALTGTTDVSTIASPAISLLVYNTATMGTIPDNVYPGFYYWDGAFWTRLFNTPSLTSIDCSSATHNGLLSIGNVANGVSSVISYTGGNGGSYAAQIIPSTGVTGLTATLVAGTLSNGSGTLTYTISGTPTAVGTASFAISIGGKSCIFTRTVYTTATLSSLTCTSATHNGTLTIGYPASGITSVIPYTGGNGGVYIQQSIPSTGVTGLTANISTGISANGAGTVTYTITGTPSAVGSANFAITIGGQSCTLIRQVGCGAYISPTVFKVFACHNLGADTTLDPNIPVQGIHGNYYQWGRNNPVANATTASGSISGWNTISAANGSWAYPKNQTYDPCPTNFRIPTITEWQGVIDNNTVSRTGTWIVDFNQYGSAIHFGPNSTTKWLTLPAAGIRYFTAGDLDGRNQSGFYWSSSELGANSYYLYFNQLYVVPTFDINRAAGFSVRCISQ